MGTTEQELVRQVAQHLYFHLRTLGLSHVMRELEKELVLMALKETKQNCEHAAELLKVTRTCLVEKRRKHGLRLHQPGEYQPLRRKKT